MARILFVDNKVSEFERFQKLSFSREHSKEIQHVRDPVGLADRIAGDPEVRMVILDILWEQDSDEEGSIELGASAMREIAEAGVDVPVVIYSVIEDEDALRRLVPEMMELGAFDWVSKDDNFAVRSFRFERAYKIGRGWGGRRSQSLGVLPNEVDHRQGLHVAVMFVDLSGFTALTDQVDRGDVVGVLRSFYGMVGDAVHTHAGYVDKYIGDAVMAIFGVGGAKDKVGDSGRACVEVARTIISRAPAFRLDVVEPILKKYQTRLDAAGFSNVGRLRLGAESGVVDVVRFDRGNESEITAIGTPVNIASRILGKAQPDEAWIGQNLHQNAAGAAQIQESKEVEFKNLPGKYQIHKLRA